MESSFKTKCIIVAVVIVLCVSLIGGIYLFIRSHQEKTDINTYLNELQNQSDLVTQKLTTSGVLDRETKGIPFITKDTYLVKYTASVYASTDVNEINIREFGNGLVVTVPHATIHSVEIPPENIKFYNKGLVLKRSGKNEVVKVQKAIKKKVINEAEKTGLLEEADKNAEKIVKDSIAKIDSEKKVTVEFN